MRKVEGVKEFDRSANMLKKNGKKEDNGLAAQKVLRYVLESEHTVKPLTGRSVKGSPVFRTTFGGPLIQNTVQWVMGSQFLYVPLSDPLRQV